MFQWVLNTPLKILLLWDTSVKKLLSVCFTFFKKVGALTVAVAIHAWTPILEDDLEIGMQMHLQKQPPEVLYKKSVFVKLTGIHLLRSLFFNKIASLKPATLLKKRLQHKCFLLNFAKILRTPLLENTSGQTFPILFTRIKRYWKWWKYLLKNKSE